MKRLVISLLLLFTVFSLSAQNVSDALRYSRIIYGGSSRFQGLGGAFGAVGADFSVTATNPAGIGLYRSSEISFSPSLFIDHAESGYNGMTGTDNRADVGMGSLGMVFTIPAASDGKTGFRNFTVAFGVNRQNDFNRRLYISGTNKNSSILSDFSNILNSGGLFPDDPQYQFDIGLAYNDNLFLYDSISNSYLADFDMAPAGQRSVYQTKSVSTHGSVNEFEVAFAANLEDKLYFGATIGIPFLRYYETSRYTETWNANSDNFFNKMIYDQSLETHGTGINLKVGLIYRPANWIRIGAAIHTPTYYGNMRDSWSSQMTAEVGYDTIYTNYAESPLGSYDYQMSTPFRAIGSVAFVIGTYGLVSADYEYVNYNQARFYDTGSGYDDLNKQIKSAYESPTNVRAGTEWRIMDFRLRGGFGYYGSPYQNGSKLGEKIMVSGGLGYRGKHFFLDLAYIWSKMKDDYYLYDPALVNPSHNTFTDHSVVATIGARF